MSSPNVIQVSIVGFTHQRVNRLHIFVAGKRQHVINQRVGDARHIQRRREHDRCFNLSEFVYLCRAGELSERISKEHRTRNLFAKQISAVG